MASPGARACARAFLGRQGELSSAAHAFLRGGVWLRALCLAARGRPRRGARALPPLAAVPAPVGPAAHGRDGGRRGGLSRPAPQTFYRNHHHRGVEGGTRDIARRDTDLGVSTRRDIGRAAWPLGRTCSSRRVSAGARRGKMSSSPAWQAAQKNFKWILRRPKRAAPRIARWNIARGDLVQVVEGPDKGRQGIVATTCAGDEPAARRGRQHEEALHEAQPGLGRAGRDGHAPRARALLERGSLPTRSRSSRPRSRAASSRIGLLRVARSARARRPPRDAARAALRNNEVGPKDTAPDDVLEQTIFDGIRISTAEIEALRASVAAAARGDGRREMSARLPKQGARLGLLDARHAALSAATRGAEDRRIRTSLNRQKGAAVRAPPAGRAAVAARGSRGRAG